MSLPTIFQHFERACIINLPGRKDRFCRITGELRRIGADPHCHPFEVIEAIRPQTADRFSSVGAKGIFLTHLKLFKDTLQKGHENILLMEDDFMFAKDFLSSQEPVSHKLSQVEWDIVYLGHSLPLKRHSPDLIRYDGKIMLMHFVGFHKRILHTVVDFMENMLCRPPANFKRAFMHSDNMLNLLRSLNPRIVTYVASPSLGYQGPSRSDITASVFDQLDKDGRILEPFRRIKAKWRW